MSNIVKPLRDRRWKAALGATLLVFLNFLPAGAQSPEETTPISPNLTDRELVEFSKAEPRFSAAALTLVQSRICTYTEAAATSYGQAVMSDLRLQRTTVPPRSLALTNAVLAARLYVDFTTPPDLSQGEGASTWNELGLLVLGRANAVLSHYYLAVEYRAGLEPALENLRLATRDLSKYLTAKADGSLSERLQLAKAQYATLWFEQCDEVVPLYNDLLGNGARGAIRDALVLRPDLPLVTGWTWEQRKRADEVHKQFVQNLLSSSNSAVRVEGLLLHTARTRTERAFAAAFTNVVEAIELEVRTEGTRTAYAALLKEILNDRNSRSLLDKTRNELRGLYEARFVATAQQSTNSQPAIAPAPKTFNKEAIAATAKPATNRVASVPKIPTRPKPPLSWQALLSPADIRYWEEMPQVELRALAKNGDVIANYYVFLKLGNSDSRELVKEAEAGLQRAFNAEFPQAQLAHAKRQTDSEERFYWTKKAAGTGYPAAQFALGELHIRGHGTAIDLDRGLGLIRAAYDLNVPEAESTLADLYASGIGGPRDPKEKPATLFLSAARKNDSKAMLELHHRYLSGYQVVRDQLEASRWLVNAGLHSKDALAKYLDESGKARPQTSADLDQFAKTLAVYSQAVIHKQPDAIKHVAEWYEHGSVGRKSSVRAYALATMAKSSDKIPAEFVQRLRSALTPQELKTAEVLVAQWQKITPDLM